MSGGAGDKTDATVHLPDEVLRRVLSFLPLKDKLRSEAVNHRFQRCVLQELRATPQPLAYNIEHRDVLNGYHVPPEAILGAVQMLAKKAMFSRICLFGVPQLDSVLSLLLSEARCLRKVTSFDTDSRCSQAILENFLDRCEKLSTMNLFSECSLYTNETCCVPRDLGHLLRNRCLTELKLSPILYTTKGLTGMFKQIRPNALRKLDLLFMNKRPNAKPVLGLDELFDALVPNGSVLEDVDLDVRRFDIRFAPLFDSLALLPALSRCNIETDYLGGSSLVAHQFVPAVTSLFNLSHVNISVTYSFYRALFPSGCQFVNMIRQIQRVHRSMWIEFDALDFWTNELTLSLGNASIRIVLFFPDAFEQCGDENCALCPSFYPSLLSFVCLRAQAAVRDSLVAQQFPNWHLDRCKLDKVVDDLNNNTFDSNAGEYPTWRALSVEESDAITIQFENHEDDDTFSISLSYGQCLTNGCVMCAH